MCVRGGPRVHGSRFKCQSGLCCLSARGGPRVHGSSVKCQSGLCCLRARGGPRVYCSSRVKCESGLCCLCVRGGPRVHGVSRVKCQSGLCCLCVRGGSRAHGVSRVKCQSCVVGLFIGLSAIRLFQLSTSVYSAEQEGYMWTGVPMFHVGGGPCVHGSSGAKCKSGLSCLYVRGEPRIHVQSTTFNPMKNLPLI